MEISLENVSNLGRKMKVVIPPHEVELAIADRLNSVSKTLRIDGFRPGKVPQRVVRQRFGNVIRDEVYQEKIRTSLEQALKQHALEPAVMPAVEITQPHDPNQKPLEFVATFDVLPHIELPDFSQMEIVKETAEVTELDVEKVLKRLRKQYSSWEKVDRTAAEGDQVTLNFEGFINGEAFPGGKAESYPIELGSGSMIAGFEDQLVGVSAGTEREIQVTFPENYHAQDLSGKQALFKVKVLEVSGRKLPVLDDAFAASVGIREGGMARLRDELKKSLQRELTAAELSRLKHNVMEQVLKLVPVDLPASMVNQELYQLQRQALERIKNQLKSFTQDPSQLAELMKLQDTDVAHLKKQAERRVALGLILSEIIKKENITLDKERVAAKVSEIAEMYEDSAQAMRAMMQDTQRLSEIEAIAMEEQLVDFLLQKAKVEEKTVSYDKITQTEA